MYNKYQIVAFVFFHSLTSLAYSPKEGNITTYFGPYIYKSNFEMPSQKDQKTIQNGLGIVVNGDINPQGSLEFSLFYLNKNYSIEAQNKQIIEQTDLAQFSVGYRRWVSERCSLSLTFTSGYSMGTPRILHSDFNPGELQTSAHDVTEYGFDFAAQAELYNWESVALILDTRYLLSVTSKVNEKADHYGVLIGLKYLYQEK